MRRKADQEEEQAPVGSDLQAAAVDLVERLESGQLTQGADADYTRKLEETRKRASEATTRKAKELAAGAEARRLEFLKAREEGRPLPAVSAASISVMEDPTVPLDRSGQPLDPSFVYKWGRMCDAAERDDKGAHLAGLIREGYEVVKDPGDGQPITHMRHTLLRATPEADAERRAKHMQNLVSAGKREVRAYEDSIEGTNRALGAEAMQPYDGGTRRTKVSLAEAAAGLTE